MSKDDKELLEILSSDKPSDPRGYANIKNAVPEACCDEPMHTAEETAFSGKTVQWTSGDGKRFFPAEPYKRFPPVFMKSATPIQEFILRIFL
jgi:hypothetical protein